MKLHPSLLAVVALLALAACRPGAAEYTEAEAPKNLTLDNVSGLVNLRFAAGSSRLLPADAARLRAMAASGGISPSDRVSIAAGGPPRLASARAQTIANELLRYRIISSERPFGGVPANVAVLYTGRYLVTTPPCPNWSKPAQLDYGNALSSNFGCSTASNLGQMVWNPADLAEGRPIGLASGVTAAAAVNRYEADKVILPTAATVGPISSTSTQAPGGTGASGSAQ
ncbi:MAG TPA: CpaD family pilus assembly lipoprotein [Stellaceae bacterium]|jgi:pilus assembly protein CpaD|nr:CpaD family pilus assembly lipoprotein [Stellaceae bacterium]